MIDAAIPRECVYKQFEEHPGPCPRCGGPLQSHQATYLIVTRRGGKSADSFFVGNDMGWFCARCPTVVVNPDEVNEYLQYSLPEWNVGTEFVVAGIVDLDAVPEEKRDLPLGDDDNPIPLVEFTAVSDERAPRETTGPSEVTARPRARTPRGEGGFEQQYEDILQNIEFGIVQVYREHPDMTDWDALNAVENLIRLYNAEVKGRQPALPSLDSLAQSVYESVKMMCEWRLGRETPFRDDEGAPVETVLDPITLDEMIDCLKRVRKSINRWHREGGLQGYLTFVSEFIA